MLSKYFANKAAQYTVFATAILSFVILIAIIIFIVKEGLPTFQEVSITEFLFGDTWRPQSGQYGILAMVVGSLAVTAGALVIAVPLGIAGAILLAEVAPGRVRNFLRPAIELLVGIPSVVYGLVGMVVLVPLIRELFGGVGFSILAASIVLAIMVLPTIISISEDSIRAVPRNYKEASLALGATHWQTIRQVLLPSARSGIIASIVLGMGRAIGETMAMIMVIGNAIKMPDSILDPARTLTGNIAVEINYAADTHRQALFATGIVLLVFIMLLNSIAGLSLRRGAHREKAHA
jgi:phosphate transport system permease protein